MTGERLNYLLRLLGVSGKQAADQIGVDYSTLSKWRRGKRVLKYSSPHAKALASWALTCPSECESGAVHALLHETFPDLEGAETDRLVNALCLWLTMPEKPADLSAPDQLQHIFEVPLQTSIGLENLFDAQNQIFHMLNSLPPGQTITIADCGAVDWGQADQTLLKDGIRFNTEALACGHRMRIIDHLSSTYHPWELMFQWLPIYLQPNVSTYFYRIPQLTPLRQNLVVIHGYAALVMSSTPAAGGLFISSLYRDREYVQLFDAVVETILADSHPMMQEMEVQQLAAFLHIIDAHVKSHHVLYMINRLPTFRNMPSTLLEAILRDNNLSDELLERCMAAGHQSASTRGRCRVRQIYDLDALEAAAAQDYIIDPDLSALTGQEIRLSRAYFLKQLSYLYERKDDANYTLVLYPFSRIEMVSPPCNLIVQEDSLAAAWDAARFSRRMYSEELSIVSGFCEYADTLWESIPAVCKTQAWRKRRLNALLRD